MERFEYQSALFVGGGNMIQAPLPQRTNDAAKAVVNAAFKVHKTLGPGLLESVYESCKEFELSRMGVAVQAQAPCPVVYEQLRLEGGFRIDLLVENCVIVELKSVEDIAPVHRAQLLTYLKLTGHRLGLLINFNVPLIKDGIHRLIV